MESLCECYFDCENSVPKEDREYLSEFQDGIYYKNGYFIQSIECAELEVKNGDSIIIERYGNSALTKWVIEE